MEGNEVVPGLRLEAVAGEDVAVFSIVGAVRLRDVGRATDLGLQMLSSKPRHLVMDFSRAKQLRNIGVGMLAYYQRYLEKRGWRMTVVRPRDPAVFEGLAVDFERVFEVHETREEAIEALRSGEPGG